MLKFVHQDILATVEFGTNLYEVSMNESMLLEKTTKIPKLGQPTSKSAVIFLKNFCDTILRKIVQYT